MFVSEAATSGYKAHWGRGLKIIVPAHRPVKRSTPAHILKQARLSVEEFLKSL